MDFDEIRPLEDILMSLNLSAKCGGIFSTSGSSMGHRRAF